MQNDPDEPQDSNIGEDDLHDIVQDEKKDLLLANRRSRVTTMSFHDWFVKTYQRDYKQSDTAISEAYHAGAHDEIENSEYILEHADLKAKHYKDRCSKLSDQAQILYSLLHTVAKKVDAPEPIKKLIRKVLSEQEWYLTLPTLRQPLH